MTKPKMTPDELANAVKDLIESNGDVLTSLNFGTTYGQHNYNADVVLNFGNPPTSYFVW
jgi:hypothetical protein